MYTYGPGRSSLGYEPNDDRPRRLDISVAFTKGKVKVKVRRRLVIPVSAVAALAVLAVTVTAIVPGTTVRGTVSVKSFFNAKTNQLTLMPQPAKVVTLTMSGRVISTKFTKPAKPVTLQGYPANSSTGRLLMEANALSLRAANALPKAANALPDWNGCGTRLSGPGSANGAVIVFPVVRLSAARLFSTGGSLTGEYLWDNYEAPAAVRNTAGVFPEWTSCVEGEFKSNNGFRQTFSAVSLSDHETDLKTGNPITHPDNYGPSLGVGGTADGGSYSGSSLGGNPEPILDPGPDPWVANAVDTVWRADPTIGEIGEGTSSPVYEAEAAGYAPGADGVPFGGPGAVPSGFSVTVTFGVQMHCVSLDCQT